MSFCRRVAWKCPGSTTISLDCIGLDWAVRVTARSSSAVSDEGGVKRAVHLTRRRGDAEEERGGKQDEGWRKGQDTPLLPVGCGDSGERRGRILSSLTWRSRHRPGGTPGAHSN